MTLEHFTPEIEPWLSCDACFDHIDAVLDDLLIRDVPLDAGFRAHLRRCAACHQEALTLLELAASDHGTDPALALARLEAELGGAGLPVPPAGPGR
jgi:hypothetical protein